MYCTNPVCLSFLLLNVNHALPCTPLLMVCSVVLAALIVGPGKWLLILCAQQGWPRGGPSLGARRGQTACGQRGKRRLNLCRECACKNEQYRRVVLDSALDSHVVCCVFPHLCGIGSGSLSNTAQSWCYDRHDLLWLTNLFLLLTQTAERFETPSVVWIESLPVSLMPALIWRPK